MNKKHTAYSATSRSSLQKFSQEVYAYYNDNKRNFAWRRTDDPYHIVVSEIMLQQTQTHRVQGKFELFIETFPHLSVLAEAPLQQLIAVWQGLGYNRRALALQAFAQRVIEEYKGIVPPDPVILETFKGIGPATAASICAFAFNQPTVFIETNVRAVYIHHFFPGCEKVSDKELMPLVEQTLDRENPRHWYYALMDYGVMLKKQHKNPSRKSAHYVVQSKFEGSDRQVRGHILKLLVQSSPLPEEVIIHSIEREPDKIARILSDLEQEGFIVGKDGFYALR